MLRIIQNPNFRRSLRFSRAAALAVGLWSAGYASGQLEYAKNPEEMQFLMNKNAPAKNAAAGHRSLFPKFMISEPCLSHVWYWSGTGLVWY